MKFIGPTLYLEKENALITGDLHIGLDHSISELGTLNPVIGLTEIKEKFLKIINKINKKLNYIILLGDIANFFKPPSHKEIELIKEFLNLFKDKTKELIIIKGNHDKFIQKNVQDINLNLIENFELEDYSFQHGDKIIPTTKKNIIIGHEHPAITLNNGIRTEKFKCIIISKYKQQKLIVLPSFNNLTLGTDISKEKLISPYLSTKIVNESEIKVVDELKIYDFGKLKNLNK